MTLQANIGFGIGMLDLAVVLDAEPGETVAVLGPNGAGKTTLLRCLAGLTRLDAGRIVLDDVVLDDPGQSVFVPPQQRPIGVVFQEHRLFPSMSVLDNVAFGLRCRGSDRKAARRQAGVALEQMGLQDRAADRPRILSGGQSQRVALARALVTNPALLLLDEPLAALDVTTKVEIRRELRQHLQSFDGIRILVSHDPVDAFALAERVVIIEDGKVSQAGRLADVAARPRSRYVADLIGVNLFEGHADGQELTVGNQRLVTVTPTTGDVFVLIHPRSVALHHARPDGSPRNVWQGTVADIDLERDRARFRIDGTVSVTAEVTSAAAAQLDARPGDPMWVSVKATEVHTYPR